MQDAEPGETFGEFGGDHGGAVVAHGGARQAALLQGLTQAMDDGLGGLVKIPLQVADEPGAIVDDAEEQRRVPSAARRQYLARAVMDVPVPEAADIRGLVAADLARGQARFGLPCAGGLAVARPPPFVQAVRAQETPDGGIGRERAQVRAAVGERRQVVMDQLGAPSGMVGVELAHGEVDRRGDRALPAGIAPALAAQDGDRVLALVERAIIPALDGCDGEPHRFVAGRVQPAALGEPGQLGLEGAGVRWGRQQMSDNREPEPGPAFVALGSFVLCHAALLKWMGARIKK